jgi:lysozyme family protein
MKEYPLAFEKAFPEMIAHEGGYANVSGDSGGETFMGISRNNFPNWEGWAFVDEVKRGGGARAINAQLMGNPRMVELVKAFYFAEFWEKTK